MSQLHNGHMHTSRYWPCEHDQSSTIDGDSDGHRDVNSDGDASPISGGAPHLFPGAEGVESSEGSLGEVLQQQKTPALGGETRAQELYHVRVLFSVTQLQDQQKINGSQNRKEIFERFISPPLPHFFYFFLFILFYGMHLEGWAKLLYVMATPG